MAYGLEDSFWFPKELGERLAELRKKRGLTQPQLAILMGRQGKGGKSLVCRLEKGDFKTPSLRLVGDFLRACGAGFKDVLDVLDKYTSSPNVVDRQGLAAVREAAKDLPEPVASQVVSMDIKTAAARRFEGKLPEPPAKRAERSARYAEKRMWLARLHTHIVGVIVTQKLRPGPMNEGFLQVHGRELWAILDRTKADASRRAELLRKAEQALLDQNVMDPACVHAVQEAVVQFYRAQVEGHASRSA